MRFLAGILSIVVISLSATAQESLTPQAYIARVGRGAQVVPTGDLTIDGKKVGCKQSPAVLDPNLDDFALSYPGFIVLRPDVIKTVTTTVALWIYYHECGHLHGIKDESKADCFAIARGRREKWLTPQGLEEVCAFISKGRADSLHLGGADRCTRMRHCYRAAGAPAHRSLQP